MLAAKYGRNGAVDLLQSGGANTTIKNTVSWVVVYPAYELH